jgi:hypothetical protein
MGRFLAYTLNISSSSKLLEKSLSNTPATLYDRRERVPNIWVSSHILSGLLKSSAFKDHGKEIISFYEESYLTTMVKEHWHVNVFVFIFFFFNAKEEKYDILVGCYLFYVLTKSRKREMYYV